MLVATLALAIAPQAACDVTVHEAPAPAPPIGRRLAVDGDLMVALGPQASPATATFWRWSLDGWAFEDSAVAPVDPFYFGGSVAIARGDVLIATTDAFNGASVDVFTATGGNWSTGQSLSPFRNFVHGALADVGLAARGSDVYLGNTWNGEIEHLTRQSNGVWTSTIVATNLAAPAGFGSSLDMDENWLIASAGGVGQVFVYPRAAGGALGAPFTLTSGLGATGFGVEVTLDGSVAVVRSAVGPLEAFWFDGVNWVSTGEVPIPGSYLPSDVERIHYRGGILALGLPQVPGGGRVVEVQRQTSMQFVFWTGVQLRRPLYSTDDGLGADVLRTPYGTVAGGAGYVQRWPEDIRQYTYCRCDAAIAACGNPGVNGCINASGMSARLQSCGSRSLADANLAFVATNLNAGTWGLLFHGPVTGAPFPSQNGTVCVGAPALRYLPRLSHGTQLVIEDAIEFDQANHPALGRLTAGETFGFQLWYRDVGGPCGATSNFTNATAVPFLP